MKHSLPKRLQKGDTIAIISPSSPANLPRSQINKGYAYLRTKGFKVLDFTQRDGGYGLEFSKEKARIINKLFADKNVAAIMAFWGGLLANQVLDYLDFSTIKSNPKIIVGYSDITAVTSAITAQTGLVTFSGPGLISFIKPQPFEYTWEYFEKACIVGRPFQIKPATTYADDQYFLRKNPNRRVLKKNVGWKIFKSGRATGNVVAGNLQTLLVLSGTKYFVEFKNSILFVEEDEYMSPELFLRLMIQLKQMKAFEKINGLVIGRFCEQTSINFTVIENILKIVLKKDTRIPVVYNVDFGHSDPMVTLPNGGFAKVNTLEPVISFEKAVL